MLPRSWAVVLARSRYDRLALGLGGVATREALATGRRRVFPGGMMGAYECIDGMGALRRWTTLGGWS